VGCEQRAPLPTDEATQTAPIVRTRPRVRLASGADHSLAIRPDGTVWAAGRNDFGQLGTGGYDSTSTPVQVQSLTGAVSVSGGTAHSVALRSDGTVWAWGDNWMGQLGDGTNLTRRTPVQVQGLDRVTSVSAGRDHTLAA